MTITVNIPAHHLDKDREIHIYLPPGYDDDPDKTYPVLYMHDGQNIFNDIEAYTGKSWNIDITADRLLEEGKIDEIIIVGVSNTEWRDDEYTPTYDKTEESGGYADHYLNYLLEDVKPFVDANFRTKPFRQDTGICGSSLGGLLSIYAAFEHPEQFGRVAAISPSLWWDDRVIFDLAARWDRKGHEFLFWLDIGVNEADDLDAGDDDDEKSDVDPIEDARDFRDLLLTRGFTEGGDLIYFEDAWGFHDEISWGQRMEKVLIYLFGTGWEEDHWPWE